MASICWIPPAFQPKLNQFNQNPRPKTTPNITCQSNKAITRKHRYGGSLPSILRALDTIDDTNNAMAPWADKLSPKEQTIILKEQRDWGAALRVFRWMRTQPSYIPNVIHYNVVLRILGRAEKFDELRLLWIDMAKDGVLPTNNTYGMLVDVYAKAGLVREAMMWLKHMKQRNVFPDEVTMNTVVRVLKDTGEFEKGDKFYKNWCEGKVELDSLDLDKIDESETESDLFSPKRFLSTELFKAGGRIPPSRQSQSQLSESSIRKPRMTATYNTLIDLYGKAGRLKDASSAFAEMLKSGVAPDTITFNTMMYTCGTHGLLSEAEFLLARMEEKRVFPDTKSYNIFLTLYADQGNIDAALGCYRKIREVGLAPDEVTYRAVLHILCNKNMVEEVESIIEEMKKSNVSIDEHSLPVITRMYVHLGYLDRAKSLFETRHLEGHISSKTYAAVIDAYADKGLWAEAELVFYRKTDSFVHKKDIEEYNVMIKAYGKAKLYDNAISLFKGMKSSGTWPDACTYNSLIQMLSSGGIIDLATGFLSEMQEAGFKPPCTTFSAVITAFTRLGQVSEAVNVLKEMTRVGVEPNEIVYGSLINGFAEAGMVEDALRYFHAMEDSGIYSNQIVLSALIKAYSKVGCLEGAQKLYAKMMDMEGGPDIVASNSMLTLCADHGILAEAELIFGKLKENGQADGVSYATMMLLYKNMGMIDKAIDISQEMQESNLLTDCGSFNAVLTSYGTNGQLRECGELLQQMITRKILPDGGTYRVMLTVLKKGGADAEVVSQIEACYREGKPFAREALIASVFSSVGLHAFALECCKAFVKTEIEIDLFAYNVAISVYGSSGKVDDALTTFMRMQDLGIEPDLVTYINLVGCYGKAGMVEGIKRIYNQLLYGEIELNESLFTAVINAYKDANRNDLAELVSQEMKFSSATSDLSDSEAEEDDSVDFSDSEAED